MMQRVRGAIWSIALVVLVAIAGTPRCAAQMDTGNIAGKVTDSTGAVVSDVLIQVTNAQTENTWHAKTGKIGEYSVPSLPVGTYIIKASRKGFETEIVTGFVLHSSETASANLKLTVGAVTEEVTVTADQVETNLITSDTGTVVNNAMVQALPLNGRDLYDLTTLVPGSDITGGSMNGNETLQHGMNTLVDGTDATRGNVNSRVDNMGVSQSRVTRASVDSIQEVRILSSNYSAQYGRANGVIIDVITKSGSNDTHGGIFEFFRNDYMDAKDYFTSPGSTTPLRLNQFGGTLGGHLIKNKLFYFINYEGVRQNVYQATFSTVANNYIRGLAVPAVQPIYAMLPSANNLAPTLDETAPVKIPNSKWFDIAYYNTDARDTEDTGSAKFDWTLGSQDKLSFRYNINNGFTDVQYSMVLGEDETAPNRVQLGKLTWDHTFRTGLLNEAGLAVNRPSTSSFNPGGGFPLFSCFFCGGAGFGSLPGPQILSFSVHMPNLSVQALDLATKVLSGRIGQLITFGFDIRAVRTRNDLGNQYTQTFSNGTVKYDTAGNWVSGAPDGLATNSGVAWGLSGHPLVALYSTQYAFFVNDDLRLLPRFTLNLGLRYDYATAAHDPKSQISNFNFTTFTLEAPGTPLYTSSKTDIGPRLGFNLDIFGNGKTSLRGGVGIFYLPVDTGTVANLESNNYPDFKETVFNEQNGTLTSCTPAITFTYPLPATPPVCSPALPKTMTGFDAKPKDIHTDQWNLSLQRQLAKGMVWDIGYVASRGFDVYSTGNLDPQLPSGAYMLTAYPQYAGIVRAGDFASQWYNSLQTSLRAQIHSLQLNLNYTWSHETDNSSGFLGDYQDIYDLKGEWASGDNDVRQIFSGAFVYGIPSLRNIYRAIPKRLAEGWNVVGNFQERSGLPVNIIWGGSSIAQARPNLVVGQPIQMRTRGPSRQFNPSAFSAPSVVKDGGTYGNCPRNIARGPNFMQPDLSLSKSTPLREKVKLDMRVDIFNFINHPNFQNPSGNVNSGLFGSSMKIVSQYVSIGTARQLQISARVNF